MEIYDVWEHAKGLSHHHQLFYKIFELGEPLFTDRIDTAAVSFDIKTGQTQFLLNKDFYGKLNEHTRLFTVAHEAMHILLEHGLRTIKKNHDPEISNIAQDIVINEMLVNEFGFEQKKLNFEIKICFLNTVFTKDEIKSYGIIRNGSYEYYYDLIKKIKPKNDVGNGASPLDVHGSGDSVEDVNERGVGSMPEVVLDDIVEVASGSLDNKEKKEIVDAIEEAVGKGLGLIAGVGSYGEIFAITDYGLKKESRWEDLVKKKISSLYKKDIKYAETFSHIDRKHYNLSKDMVIPSVRELEGQKSENRYNLYFYLDTSGSCIDYADDFFNLVKTIPTDVFNIKLFCFDNSVYQIDPTKPEVIGGGGTSFSIIEDSILLEVSKEKNPRLSNKYPDLVFVLTDGYGDNVYPQKDKNWYWLLTPNNTKNCIPKNSNIIGLNELKDKYKIKSSFNKMGY